MELKELKKKKVSDLHNILAEQRNKLRELRFKDANKQLKDVRQIRKTRNIIAQALTLLNASKQENENEVKKKTETEKDSVKSNENDSKEEAKKETKKDNK